MKSPWKQSLTSLALAAGLAGQLWAAPATQSFKTPEDAARALQTALSKKDQAALLTLFGPDYKRVQVEDAAERAATDARLVRLFKEGWSLSTTQDQHRVIRLGWEGWVFPVPLIKKGSLWSFDTPAGVEEIANRRVGRNELMAIDTFHAIFKAQEQYKKDTGKYAARVASSTGSRDGLFWTATNADKSPLQQVVGDVAGLVSSHTKGTPWYGYYYTLTTTKDGFVLAAWPANHNQTGVQSFWMDQSGRLYEKDLGNNGGAYLRGADATTTPTHCNLVQSN